MAVANLTKNHSPYRPPCSGQWSGKIFTPGRNHYRASDSQIAEYKNISQLLNSYCTPPSIMTLQAIQDCISSGDTSPSCGNPCDTGGCNPITIAPSGGTAFPGYANWPNNFFSPTGKNISRASCYKLGFKNVQAYKLWQGAYGFLDNCQSCGPITASDCSWCSCGFQPYTPNAPTTKYLRLDASLSMSSRTLYFGSCPNPGDTCYYVDVVAQFQVTIIVDRYSGNVTVTNVVDTATVSTTDDIGGPPTTGPTGFPVNTLLAPSCPKSFDGYVLGNGSDCLPLPINADGSSGNGPGTLHIAVSETSYTYSFQSDPSSIYWNPCIGGGPGNLGCPYNYTFAMSVSLSQPYASSDVNLDCESLLSEWDLTDDVTYPFRHDTAVNQAPFVTLDEVLSNPFAFIGRESGTNTNKTYQLATGSVVGRPSPAGYGLYFDCAHPNYAQGQTIDGVFDPYAWFIASWGAFAPDWCPQATQWTNNYWATGLYGGAYSGNGGVAGFPFEVLPNSSSEPIGLFQNGCFKQKWAETILFVKPSHNFARPCGAIDRATIDQSTINCTTNPAGNLRWPSAPCDCDFSSNAFLDPYAPGNCPPVGTVTLNPWNDIGVKGQFVVRSLTYNARDVGEYARLQAVISGWDTGDCGAAPSIPMMGGPYIDPRNGNTLVNIDCQQLCEVFQTCAPVVYCVSPNGEQFQFGTTQGLPQTGIDESYGSFSFIEVDQWMVDPLFQVPVPPCGSIFTYAQDNGECQPCSGEPQVCYYQVPYEECLCELPDGAPPLPSYVNLGVTLNSDFSWSGNLSDEPQENGVGYPTPWSYWLNQIFSCCDVIEAECQEAEEVSA